MAYRPTNDTTENVIHRNTIFDSQGMVSCCTCGYCIKKTQDATLTLTNFKAADPLINENSIGSTIIEFSDYMIPSGSFEGYVLTPTYDSTTLFPDGFGTISYHRLIPNKDTSNISSALSYYPFLNCSGATSISYWPGPEFDENGYRKRNVKIYGIETEGGVLSIISPPRPPIVDNVVENYYIHSQYFGKKNYRHFESSITPLYSDNFSWYAPYDFPGNCTFETFREIMSYNNSASQFSPKPEPPITSTGDITNLMNYVSTNEYSAFGFKPESSCTNNIVKVMNPVRFLDVSGYNFSYTYPSYSLVSSTPRIFPDSSENYPGYYPFVSNQYLRSNFAFDKSTGEESKIYKDGYILGGFSLKNDGSFSSKLSLINTDKVYNSTFNGQYIQLTGTAVQAVDFNNYYPCWGLYFIYAYDAFLYKEPVLEGYAPIIGSAFSVPSATYDEQNPISYYTNGYFERDFIRNSGSFDPYFFGQKDEVFFGRKLYSEGGNQFYYPNQPALILDYNAVKTNRTQITSSTNASGWTTMKIKNVLWVGKTLLTKTYEHNLGVNRPRLSIGAVPLRYDAILKGGFESDIEVGFQSIPLCKITNIVDELSRVTSLKVNFENYQKIPQQNMIGYEHLLSQFSASPAMEGLTNLIGQYGQIANSYSYVPAFASFYVYGATNYQGWVGFYSASDFENIGYFPPNENQNNEFIIKRSQSDSRGFYRFNLIQKDIVAIDPPVLTSYVAKAGRAYPDFGVADRFKSCLLINGDKDVWKTGNEVQFVGLDYLVTNGGSGYTSVPTVTLSNGGGTGATAYARISNGKVISVTVGNKGKDYTSNKTVVISGGGGNGATAVDISFTPFYSIYMEEIKDEKQTAGQTLIRIARTLQDANNGVYIPNVGLETLYKDRSLSVKFLYGFKEVSVENLPRYKNANRNLASTFNENAERINAYYHTEGECYNSFTSKFNFMFISNGYFDIRFTQDNVQGQYAYMNIGSYLTHGSRDALASYSNFVPNQNIVNSFPEIITLSPLKIKYRNVRFDDFDGSYFFMSYQRTAQQPYLVPVTYVTNFNSWDYGITRVALYGVGFQCDIVMEEVVDEFIQEALPASFNQILQNVEYIQTSNMMNSRTPMQMINPERCEHIGKVIDRKNCNCPKKWVRECDLHGKTDWKNCMQCKDFEVSE